MEGDERLAVASGLIFYFIHILMQGSKFVNLYCLTFIIYKRDYVISTWQCSAQAYISRLHFYSALQNSSHL